MKQSEIDRAIMLFYRSNNSQDFINYVRPAGWLDKLPMKGLSELATLLESARNDVLREMAARPVYNETDLDARDQLSEVAGVSVAVLDRKMQAI